MEHVKSMLLLEVVRFLEMCQDHVENGKIGFEDYYSMKRFKFNFIDNVLSTEKDFMAKNRELSERINKLYCKDDFICSSLRKAVGK